MGYYPIGINLTDKKCLIVGGGEVALRKAHVLLEAGARVIVITPKSQPDIENLDGVEVIYREYRKGDVLGYALVFAATDDRKVNAQISGECESEGVLINVVDDPELCSFIVPAMVRRGDLLLAVFTSGKSPALSKKIRKELEKEYGPEYTEFVNLLGRHRDNIKAKYPTQAERERVFGRLVNSGILELIREGKVEEAEERAIQCI